METFYFWPQAPGLSIALLIVVSMVFLYLAREPMHKALENVSDGIGNGLKRVGTWARARADAMYDRDRKVLLESGIFDTEQKLYEQLVRVEESYAKHLKVFPALQRRLDDSVNKIDADYRECGQTTPEAPGWSEAVAAIATTRGLSGDRVIEKMLTEIHKSAIEGEKRALAELRESTNKRLKVLGGMAPVWTRIQASLKDIGDKVSMVLDTTKRIDKHMSQFEKIRKGDQNSIDMLAFRTTLLFVFSIFIIGIAALGAFVNFQLIAFPMSQLIPTSTRIMGLLVSDISALVVISLEVMCGIFLLESIGVTNIIPQMATMSRGKRRLIFSLSVTFLFLFACAEASLGILREILTEKEIATTRALVGESASPGASSGSGLAVIGQATLGFLLPWVLALVAMPLEVFFATGMHMVRKVVIALTRAFGHLCNLLGHLVEYTIRIVLHLYDAYIVVPRQIGGLVGGKVKARAAA